MKAYLIEKYGDRSAVRAAEVPAPEPGADDVLVEIHAASVNPLDFKIRDGTKLMDIEHAGRWARCLTANSRFTSVEIQTSRRAKSAHVRYFVTYLPSSASRQTAMLDRQQDARNRRADEQEFTFCHDGDHDFYHCLSHTSGETYDVTLNSCSCPDHQFHCAANGLACKHRLALASALRRGEVGEFETVPAPVAVYVTHENANLCNECAADFGLSNRGKPRASVPCDDCGRQPVVKREALDQGMQWVRDQNRFEQVFGP